MIIDTELKEVARLRSLRELEIVGTPPEPEFDGLVRAAALVCEVPISLITLIDEDRQWFKASVGLAGLTETPREVAFCNHAIEQAGVMEVQDTTVDSRFADNPFVVDDPKIRFYAGATLTLKNGLAMGTLCVIDCRPRILTENQRNVLTQLAAAAVQALEARRTTRELAVSRARFVALSDASPLGVFATNAEGRLIYTNPRWRTICGVFDSTDGGFILSLAPHPDDRLTLATAWKATIADGLVFDREFRVYRGENDVRFVHVMSRPVHDGDGVVTQHVGSLEDITARKEQDEALRKSEQLLNRMGATAQLGGWEFDVATQDVIWTAQTCRLHGLSPGCQPTFAEAISFYAPEVQSQVRSAIDQAIKQGTGWDLELPLRRTDGQHRWVRIVGLVETDVETTRVLSLHGTIQDITAQRVQRQQLHVAHERLSLATDSGHIGIWDWDLLSDTLIWAPGMFALYRLSMGIDAGHVSYHCQSEYLDPDECESVEQAVRNAIVGATDLNVEFRATWGDGSVHVVKTAAQVIRDTAGVALRMVGVSWDLTELQKRSDELADEHELPRVTLQSIGDGVITTNAQGVLTSLNPVAEQMTGWSLAEAKDRSVKDVYNIIDEVTGQFADNPAVECLSGDPSVVTLNSSVLKSRNGLRFGIDETATPIRGANGAVLGAVLVFRDVTERRRLSREMQYRATHDSLTSLVNRAEFENRLERTLENTRRHNGEHSLLYIDLDQFKLVNDACGHGAGDQLLTQVSHLLSEGIGAHDTLARIGGDEFAIILKHCEGNRALRVAQQICDRVFAYRFQHDALQFRIGASIGLVVLDKRWPTIDSVLQAADRSCYAAKDAGRNRVNVWSDTDSAMLMRRAETQWASRLAQALDEERFVLYFQCVQSLTTRIEGLHGEVLLRLREADGSLILPTVFLPAAERFDLIVGIDSWVLDQVLARLVALTNLHVVDTLFVNLSGKSIGDVSFQAYALDALRAAGEGICQRLCLEITETAAVTNIRDAAQFIEQVQVLGVRVALDDFGAGVSSFSYLKTLKVNLLKIDGQLIQRLGEDPLDNATVGALVDVARATQMPTVAEWVECPETLERIKALNVAYAQGFLLHQPEPLDGLLQAQSGHTATDPEPLPSLA